MTPPDRDGGQSRGDPSEVSQVLAALRRRASEALDGARLSEARSHAEQALAYQEAHAPDDQGGRIRSLEILRDVHLAEGRLDAARRTARRIAADVADQHGLEAARAAHGLGLTSARIGDVAAARREFTAARDTVNLLPERGDPAVRELYAAILAGLAAVSEGDAADQLFEEAIRLRLDLSGEDDLATAQVLSAWAIRRSQAGDDGEALRLSQRALAARSRMLADPHPDIARSLIEVGWLHARLGDLRKASRFVLEALVALTAVAAPTVEARALFLMAAILSERGAPSAALLFNKASVQILQRLRRTTLAHEPAFLAARGDVYRELAAGLLSAGRWPEAQAALQLLKATDLDLDPSTFDGGRMEVPFSSLEAGLWDDLQAGFRGAEANISACGARGPQAAPAALFELEKLLETLEDALSASAPAKAHAAPRQEHCAAGAARLQYLLSPDRVRILATTRYGARGVEVAFPAQELQREALALRVAIGLRSPDWLPHARAIYDRLIRPISRDLTEGGVERLEVSLDGVLRNLPLAVLHDGRCSLVERFAVTVDLGLGRQEQVRGAADGARAAGFGVARAAAGHSALGGVAEELRAVVRQTGETEGALAGVVHLDEAFTAASLRAALAEGYDVIHLASHFVLAPAREGGSYLLLGDGTTMPVTEFASLGFAGVDLLTLSACDTATGGGRWDDGRDFEGMAALALANGARRVMATHWPIRDRTSARLMRTFYRGRYREGLAAEEALRQAQLDILREPSGVAGRARGLGDPDAPASRPRPTNAHPYYWAPYVLMQ